MSRPRRQLLPASVRLNRFPDPFVRGFFADPYHDVLNALSTDRCVLRSGVGLSTEIRRNRERLAFDAFDGIPPASLAIPMPLLVAATTILEQNGISCEVGAGHFQVPALPVPSPPHAGRCPGWLNSVLECVQRLREVRLVIDRSGPSPEQITEWIVRSFPTATIAVVSESRAQCHRLAKRMADVDGGVAELSGGGTQETLHRVVVGTWMSGVATQEFEFRNIVIFPEARHAIGERGRACVQYARQARLIGIARAEEHESPWEKDWLTALFGFYRVALSARETIGRERGALRALHRQANLRLAEFVRSRRGASR